jgi:hypothetical protein
MAKPNQRLIVKDFIKQQAKDLKKHSYAEQMSDFYESRITAATLPQDLLNVKEDILKHKKENTRFLRKFNLKTTAAVLAISLTLATGGSFAVVASTAHMMVGADAVVAIIVGLASYVVGSSIWPIGQHFFGMQDKYRLRTEADNNALTAMAERAQQKINLQGPDQSQVRTSAPQAQAKAPSFFGRLCAVFKKSASKPATTGAAPAAKTSAESREPSNKG